MDKKNPNLPSFRFNCTKCDYSCHKKSHWVQHIKTKRHITGRDGRRAPSKKNVRLFSHPRTNDGGSLLTTICSLWDNVGDIPITGDSWKQNCVKNEVVGYHAPSCTGCGKVYATNSGLWKHRLKCEFACFTNKELMEKNRGYKKELGDKHALFKLLVADNVDFRKQLEVKDKIIGELNEIIAKQIEHNDKHMDLHDKNTKLIGEQVDSAKKQNEALAKAAVNNMTNCNNNYTINMFLNEKCKDAMSLGDFVEGIQLTLKDLDYTSENGTVKGLSKIFLRNLEDMEVTQRPIHCSDQKRLQFYVKDKDKWEKDKNNARIDQSIENIKVKQGKKLTEWVTSRIPENDNLNSQDNVTYYEMVSKVHCPINDKERRSIKKSIGENIKWK